MRKFLVLAAALAAAVFVVPASAGAGVRPHSVGLLDCNGRSPVQKSVRVSLACSDPRSIYDGKSVHFFDNGQYIGHDEPIIRFLSKRHGSGNDVTWIERLPRDPKACRPSPTRAATSRTGSSSRSRRGSRWRSATPQSYPLNPCKPRSDSNAPKHPPHVRPGRRRQLVPRDAVLRRRGSRRSSTTSRATTPTGARRCTSTTSSARSGSQSCNNNCIEPTNFAFIQTDGVPTGPPSPQLATAASFTPNGNTLLMNPGDRLRIHIWDARLPGGGHALETSIKDLTTGQSGFMIASAKNGFMQTSIADCSGTPFNYQPEYSTAKKAEHHPVGGARDQHLDPVRDRPLRAVHLGAEPDADHARDVPRHDLAGLHEPVRVDDDARREAEPGDQRRALLAQGLHARRRRRRPTRWRAASRPSPRTATWTSTARPTGPIGRARRRPTTGRRRSSRCSRRPAATDTRGSSSRRTPRRARRAASRPASAARFLRREAPGSSTRGGRRPR